MPTKKSTLATQVSEQAPRYGKRKRAEKVDLNEIQWMLEDHEGDAQALIKLCDFLAERNLRTHPSSCESAMRAIDRLTQEVKQLKAELA